MKLVSVELSLAEKLNEFDSWITASIQEVNETLTYRKELDKISRMLDSLGVATNGFESVESCNAERMAYYCVLEVERIITESGGDASALAVAIDVLDSLISMLFLVTGKSDNNMKCQFPVYLFQSERRTTFPVAKKLRGGELAFEYEELGRVIKQEKVSKLIAETLVLRRRYAGDVDLEGEATWLLKGYINSILAGDGSTEQLWALGVSYFNLRANNPGCEGSLLAPIVAFKVRGSVAAQSGHLPEKILRRFMSSWGMKPGLDYNVSDVVIHGDELQFDDLLAAAAELDDTADGGRTVNDLSAEPTKTRAYDFVLPYRTPGWTPSIFMQSQFYAGDSGSVSHKVVDQTRASRILTRAKFPSALFIEYLDGAGYYSSLYRDLKHMVEMPSTADFIQIRTAHTKLRRALQSIGFLTPLDFAHGLFRSDGDLEMARIELESDGYTNSEISRCYEFCLAEALVFEYQERIRVSPRLLVSARRIMLLDIVLIEGGDLQRVAGSVAVYAPGMGRDHGIGLHALGRAYQRYLRSVDSGATRFSFDLDWLARNGFVQIRTI